MVIEGLDVPTELWAELAFDEWPFPQLEAIVKRGQEIADRCWENWPAAREGDPPIGPDFKIQDDYPAEHILTRLAIAAITQRWNERKVVS